jgi:hypothetical protein
MEIPVRLNSFAIALVSIALCVVASGCGKEGSIYLNGTASANNGARVDGGATTGYSLQANNTGFTVVSYSLAQSGAAANNAALTLPASFGPTALAVDPSSGTLYIGGDTYFSGGQTPEILVYAAASTGSATPARTIVGNATTANFDEPISMTVDSSGQLYIASTPQDIGTVAVYGTTANGAATPERVLSGGATGLYQPSQLAVDATGNIYVSNIYQGYAGNIVEFPPTASGNVPPERAITDDVHVIDGVAVDSTGDVFALIGTLNQSTGYVTSAQIAEYATDAKGPATPSALISGTTTLLGTASSLRIDGKDNLFVQQTTGTGSATTQQIVAFGPGASGNLAPFLTISGSALEGGFTQFAIR